MLFNYTNFDIVCLSTIFYAGASFFALYWLNYLALLIQDKKGLFFAFLGAFYLFFSVAILIISPVIVLINLAIGLFYFFSLSHLILAICVAILCIWMIFENTGIQFYDIIPKLKKELILFISKNKSAE